MEAFAYTNKKKEIYNSSSGGAFIELCRTFERVYGSGNVAFCGAELMPDMTVRHNIVFSAEACHRFQGSKYVKSQTSGINKDIELLLQEGKAVLFSGTPCQVFALNKYLDTKGINKEDFLSIDIICHGAPDVKIWNVYTDWLQGKMHSKLIDYSFRYKKVGWMGYPAYAKFENGRELIDTRETSVYSKLHLLGYSVTKGCFNCPFANIDRKGDITLGDFWGIEDEKLDIEIRDGVSLVLTNSNFGKKIVDGMKGKKVAVLGDGFLKHQHNLLKPTAMPERYHEFWNDIQTESFEKVLQKYLKYNTIYAFKYALKKIAKQTGMLVYYRKLKMKMR